MQHFPDLLAFEMESLLNSLRRDLREQEAKALSDPDSAYLFGQNARQVKRLLEALNPRNPYRALYDSARLSPIVELHRDCRHAEAPQHAFV